MAPGVETSDKRGPRYRALRRDRGAQPAKSAIAPQAIKIWQVLPMPLQEAGVHAIDAQHDQLPYVSVGHGVAAAGSCEQRARDQASGDQANRNMGLPSIHSGLEMPKSSRTVGAMSSIPGSSASMERFENSTPGTSSGSIE